MSNRSREALMQAIFQMEAQSNTSDELLEVFLQSNERAQKADKKYVRKGFALCRDNIEDIDRIIDKYSRDWSVGRMPKVDLSLLRLAITEIMYMKELNVAIVANEVIELAKRYGSENSGRYINGVIGKVIEDLDE